MLHHIAQCGKAAIVEKSAFSPSKDAGEWSCPITLIGSAARLKIVDFNLFGGVEVPTGLGPKWFGMAAVAIGCSPEKHVPTFGSRRVEIFSRHRFWSGKIELIGVQGRELGGDLVLIRISLNIAKAISGRDRKLIRVVQARIEKSAFPMHFEIRDERVPVGN